MGVVGTYCQICGLPVQHDHYYPMDSMWGIYRGDPDQKNDSLLAFGPEHDWLKQAVGLRRRPKQEPAIIEGLVQDGIFLDSDDEDAMVFDGHDLRVALHAVCYEMAGRPDIWKPAGPNVMFEKLKPYQEQLFDLAQLLDDKLEWMLIDPRLSTEAAKKSLERIQMAVDYYTGKRRKPGLADFFELFFEKGCTRLDLRPQEPPVFWKKEEVIPHSFEKIGAGECEFYLFLGVPEPERVAFRSSGTLKTKVTFDVFGALALSITFDREHDQIFGSYERIE